MCKVLKLTNVVVSPRLWAVFVVICTFISFKFSWRMTWDAKDKSQAYSFPAEFKCPLSVPSPSPSSGWPSPLSKNVYFVETSEEIKPSFLFMCSVESAARFHPESKIIVLMKGLAKYNITLAKHLNFPLFSCFTNIEIKPLDMKDLFLDTPLADWYFLAQQRWEPYFLPILSDACRIAIMWKFGGIYLDTDFIVLKSLRNLTNVIALQSKSLLNGAFLSFTPRHKFIELCMKEFVENYSRWIWGHQGPQLFTRVFKKWCSNHSLQSSKGCRGITLLPRETFYPIRWQEWRKYFEVIKASELSELLKNTYAAHVWNKKSKGTAGQAAC
ncbi:lactosylceramide 4-alpha-galactosyltransferase-like, partial [Eublepharis macularius]|uniref:Lactosylceramide 4-alpha-galactosyltransferase n=1 Tax=Eublepharis macularius TaxID=481883 RepID=A0AA97JMM7_EUBMA